MHKFTFDSVVLYEHDLESLAPRGWITDSILEFWLEYITRNRNTQIGYLGPSVVHWIRDSVQNIPLQVLDGKALNSQILLVPINDHQGQEIGGTHWSLAVYLKESDKWFYYDSLASEYNTNLAKKTCTKIYKYIKSDPIDFTQMEISLQSNNYDCGLYVVIISEIISKNLKISKDIQFDSNTIRTRIINLIHQLAG